MSTTVAAARAAPIYAGLLQLFYCRVKLWLSRRDDGRQELSFRRRLVVDVS